METQAEGEAGPTQESDVGLDPRTLGSHPGPKAGAKPLRHPGIPGQVLYEETTEGAEKGRVGKGKESNHEARGKDLPGSPVSLGYDEKES